MMSFFSGKTRLARALVLLIMLPGFFYAGKICASESGVLVAAQDSPVQKISLLEIRRIYLGLESTADSRINRPVMNLTDSILYQAFIRNVMHMTESGFRRKTVKRIFRQGGEKVTQIKSNSVLIEHLKNNKNDVTFMDLKTAQQSKEIKVIQVLW